MDYEELQDKYKHYKVAREIKKTYKQIADIFKDNGESFDSEDAANLLKERPTKPQFPTFIFQAAIYKDVIDMIDITGIGIVMSTILSFLFGTILFIWGIGKLGGGWWKKGLIRWMMWGIAVVFFVELIPVIKIMPANAIFVLMTYYKEKKIVRLFDLALTKMHKAGIGKRVG